MNDQGRPDFPYDDLHAAVGADPAAKSELDALRAHLSDPAPNPDRIRAHVDALRGIAALWVVLYHYLTRYDQMFHGVEPSLLDHFVFPNGLYAVYLFFMISGFVIFMTLRHCNGAADFITSRF